METKLEIIRMSEVESKAVSWLWYPYIPFGKITLLQGDPGDGKIALAHLNEVPTYYNDDIGLEAWEHAIEAFRGDPKGKKIQIV